MPLTPITWDLVEEEDEDETMMINNNNAFHEHYRK